MIRNARRRLLAPAAVVAALCLVLPASAAFAVSGFGKPAPVAAGTYASTATDRAGHTVIAYSNGGIRLSSDRTGRWVTSTVTASKRGQLDMSPSLALDAQGHAYIAFDRLIGAAGSTNSIGIFLATNATGRWVVKRLTFGPDVLPSLALDAASHVHLAYARTGTAASVRYLSNATGTWKTTVVATKGSPSKPTLKLLGGIPNVAFDQDQTVNAATQPCGVYLWHPGAASTWVSRPRAGTASDFSDPCVWFTRPQLGRATDGVHVIFSYQGLTSGLYNSYRSGGQWATQRIDDLEFENASAAFAGNRIDIVTSRDLSCTASCAAHNGLYYLRLAYEKGAAPGSEWQWQGRQGVPPGRITVSSDTCNQRGPTLSGPYSCDDAPSLQLYGGHDRIAFTRSQVMFLHN
jgi:hypothetical protein